MGNPRPCVIIPTFWTRAKVRDQRRVSAIYDHPTPIDQLGTLPAALQSLAGVEGLDHVVVVVAATDPSLEMQAEDKVREIIASVPQVDAVVFGQAELGSLHRRLEQLEFGDLVPGVNLNGYGAVRNLGLLWAAVLDHDWCVFVDDDQVVLDTDFLKVAWDGLGATLPDGSRILAKSGYYVDGHGRYQMQEDPHWSDAFWRVSDDFNKALSIVDAPPRLRRSTVAFGGCLALHRDIYDRVSFDPWVLRGEDVDYVINARLHGEQVYLDGEWKVRHNPPMEPSEALKFRQDGFRFIYEHRKLEFARSQVDLHRITPQQLDPYPGELIGNSVTWRAAGTAFARAVAGRNGERSEYFRVGRELLSEANEYARANCDNYFAFQRRWPELLEKIRDDIALKSLYTGERSMDRSALTGRIPVVRPDAPDAGADRT